MLDGNLLESQMVKLLLEYLRKLQRIKDFSLSLNDIKSIDDQLVSYISDKLAPIVQLETLKLSLINTSIQCITSLIRENKLCQFTYTGPRLTSLAHFPPQNKKLHFIPINQQNHTFILVDSNQLNSRLEIYNPSNSCALTHNHPTFLCVDCQQSHLCSHCVSECHFNHCILIQSVIPSKDIGLLTRIEHCNCMAHDCNSVRHTTCSKYIHSQFDYIRL